MNDTYTTQVIISIHSPHARGDQDDPYQDRDRGRISIHSPHARGDPPSVYGTVVFPLISIHSPHARGDQHKPPKIHPNLRQLTQQNHDTPLFGALQAPFGGAEPDIRGAKRLGKP